jgi:hypothetical protein
MNILTKIEELYEEGTRSKEERRKPFPDPKLPNYFEAVYPEDYRRTDGKESEAGKGATGGDKGTKKDNL